MKRKTELITFRATVVETETYKSEGKNLYHAVLDSLEGDVQRQAQFFGFDDLFKVGDVHIVTFSPPVSKSARKPKSKTAGELRNDELKCINEILSEIAPQLTQAQLDSPAWNGTAFKARRRERDITQEEIAKRVGITQERLSQIENGARIPEETGSRLWSALLTVN